MLSHLTVCICTYKRAAMLTRLLETLEQQQTGGAFTFSIVVADNDAAQSAEPVVSTFARKSAVKTVYCSQPIQNIALTRNAALAAADGDYIAFIDDDEFPADNWLVNLVATCEKYGVAGVLGPVRPHFETPPPSWIIKGRFCERPVHPTGMVLQGSQCRTGNVLFRRDIIAGQATPFHLEFGTGGEDVDFFLRMIAAGHVFVWCEEAVAYETVPPSRWTRRFMLERALLRGRNNLKLRGQRTKALLTSVIAVPLYSLILPFTLLGGQHRFMHTCIRFCDHLGRILALFGINPVRERSV